MDLSKGTLGWLKARGNRRCLGSAKGRASVYLEGAGKSLDGPNSLFLPACGSSGSTGKAVKKERQVPLLLARGPLWMAKSMMAGTPETSSGMFSEFRDYGFTTSITLLSPASEPRPRVLNYFKKAGWGDGLRRNETRNKLSAASLYSA